MSVMTFWVFLQLAFKEGNKKITIVLAGISFWGLSVATLRGYWQPWYWLRANDAEDIWESFIKIWFFLPFNHDWVLAGSMIFNIIAIYLCLYLFNAEGQIYRSIKMFLAVIALSSGLVALGTIFAM